MKFAPTKRIERAAGAEDGYVLIAVIFLAVILLISLAIAAPKIAMSIQRDKEVELVHRGQQYKRALQLYYRQFQTYPTSIDQLVETNQVRYLRKRYTDPLTGKDDWKPVYFGQAHVRPLGFFGQPLAAVGLAGVGSGSMYAATAAATDANGVPIASPDGSATGATGTDSSSSGSASSTASSGFGSTSSSFGSSSSGFGSTSSSTFGSTSSSPTGLSSSSPFGSTGSGTSATTFGGGGPIVGFTLPENKPSLLIYKKQTHYSQWEFNYDPAEDQAQAAAGLTNGASTGGVPTSNNPFGGTSSTGTSSTGSTSTGTSSTGTGSTTTPQ